MKKINILLECSDILFDFMLTVTIFCSHMNQKKMRASMVSYVTLQFGILKRIIWIPADIVLKIL